MEAMAAVIEQLDQEKATFAAVATSIILDDARGREVAPTRAVNAQGAAHARTEVTVRAFEAAAVRLLGEGRSTGEDASVYLGRMIRLLDGGVSIAMRDRGFVLVPG